MGVRQASRIALVIVFLDLTGFFGREWIRESRLVDVREVIITEFAAEATGAET